MPTYSYRCTECANAFDIQQAFTDDTLTMCPVCGGVLRKVFSPIGVSFSGSGFYRNDSRAASQPEAKSESKGEKSDSKSDSKTEGGGGPKSESTPAPAKSEKTAAVSSASAPAASSGSGSGSGSGKKSTTP